MASLMAAVATMPHGFYSGPLLGSSANTRAERASADETVPHLSDVRQRFLTGDTYDDTWRLSDDPPQTQEEKGFGGPLAIRGEAARGTRGMRPRSASAPRPARSHTPTSARGRSESRNTYVVRAGDTLCTIADHLNVHVDDLARANGMEMGGNADHIYPNQVLLVPLIRGGKAVTAAYKTTQRIERSPARREEAGDESQGTYCVRVQEGETSPPGSPPQPVRNIVPQRPPSGDKGVLSTWGEGQGDEAVARLYRVSTGNPIPQVEQSFKNCEPCDREVKVLGKRQLKRTSHQVSEPEQPAEGSATWSRVTMLRSNILRDRRYKSATRQRPTRSEWGPNAREVAWMTGQPAAVKRQLRPPQELRRDITEVIQWRNMQDGRHRQLLTASLSIDQFPHSSPSRGTGTEIVAKSADLISVPIYCALLAFTLLLQAVAVFGERLHLALWTRTKTAADNILSFFAQCLGLPHRRGLPQFMQGRHNAITPARFSSRGRAREIHPAKGLPIFETPKQRPASGVGTETPRRTSTITRSALVSMQGRSERVPVKTRKEHGIDVWKLMYGGGQSRSRPACFAGQGGVLKCDTPKKTLAFSEPLQPRQVSRVQRRTEAALEGASSAQTPRTAVALSRAAAEIQSLRGPAYDEGKKTVSTATLSKSWSPGRDSPPGECDGGKTESTQAESLFPAVGTQLQSQLDIKMLKWLHDEHNVVSVIDGDELARSQGVQTAVCKVEVVLPAVAVTEGLVAVKGGGSSGVMITGGTEEIKEELESLYDEEDDMWDGGDGMEDEEKIGKGHVGASPNHFHVPLSKFAQISQASSNGKVEWGSYGRFQGTSERWNEKRGWNLEPDESQHTRTAGDTAMRAVPTMMSSAKLAEGKDIVAVATQGGKVNQQEMLGSAVYAGVGGRTGKSYVSAMRRGRNKIPGPGPIQDVFSRGSPSPTLTNNLSRKRQAEAQM